MEIMNREEQQCQNHRVKSEIQKIEIWTTHVVRVPLLTLLSKDGFKAVIFWLPPTPPPREIYLILKFIKCFCLCVIGLKVYLTEYSPGQLKQGKIQLIFIFYICIFKTADVVKNMWRIINRVPPPLGTKICLGSCSWTLSVLQSSQFASWSKLFADKYLSIFSCQL